MSSARQIGHARPSKVEEVWSALLAEALAAGRREPALLRVYRRMILDHASFAGALAEVVVDAVEPASRCLFDLRNVIPKALEGRPAMTAAASADLRASVERNPAFPSILSAFLHAKGFHALTLHRVCHGLWNEGRPELALYVHGLACRTLSVDVHPAAKIGVGVFVDHATGLVIGETAEVGDDVSILHGVTLGGTGKEIGNRHPKVGSGVLLGAHAVVLGNIAIGRGAKVGAGSVVLQPVPDGVTVAGVPARVVRGPDEEFPGLTMNQHFAQPE